MEQTKSQTPPRDQETVKSDPSASPLTLRRSGRARKRPAEYDDDADYQNGASANNNKNSSSSSNNTNADADTNSVTRRNPKRRATPEAFDVPENLLEASLGPWQEGEPAEWNSWIELESDPAFFTEIMKRIGVKGAKIEEVLSVDEFNLATLPEPVHGLVFLYEYVSEDSEEEDDGGEQGVWFANQTTHNACATIALLNIIMNAEGISLDERLRKFKEATRELSPPLRGNMINNSEWIRVAHNSFARRLDLLDAALGLQNEVDRKKKRGKAAAQNKRARAKQGSAKPKVRRPSDGPSAYHFIAFVPVGNQVWQLDGLSSSSPVCIGEFTKDKHWTSVMCPVLQDRMMRYETEQLSFSLLALCGDGLGKVRRRLAANVRGLVDLEGRFGSVSDSKTNGNGTHEGEEGGDKSKDKDKDREEKEEDQGQDWWRERTDRTDVIHTADDERLSSFQLDVDDILAVEVGTGVGVEAASPSSSSSSPSPPFTSPPVPDDANAAVELWDRLCAEQAKLRTEYEAEQALGGLGPEALLGRTKDYTPAVHEWVRRLAEKGALRELYETVAAGGA